MLATKTKIDPTAVIRPGDKHNEQPEPVGPAPQPSRIGIVIGWGALTVGLYTFAAAALTVDYDRVDGFGLFNALPIWFWITVALLTVGFVGFIAGEHRTGAGALVVFLTVTVHGFEPLTASHPRFSVAWLLTGFSELVADSGGPERLLDARFSWPGFFFLPATVGDQVDNSTWELVLRLWPVSIMLIWVGAVWLMASRLFPDRPLAAPIAAWSFVLIQWTGQNYFSPQSVGTSVAAVVVVLVLSWDSPSILSRGSGQSPRLRERLKWVLVPDFTTPAVTVAVAVIMVAIIAVTVSHPLSPVFIAVWLAVLAGAGYRLVRGMATWTIIVFLSWLSAAARPWWQSRLTDLVANLGDVGGSLEQSTASRVNSASSERTLVVLSRIGLTAAAAAVVLIASIWLWRRRGRQAAVLLLFMFGGPVMAVAGQPYGGEILIRVFLFAAFPAAVLFGAALELMPRRWMTLAAVVMMTAVLAPLFVVTRFGNESYETTSIQDRAAIDAAYETAPTATLFVTDNPFLSWGNTRLNRDNGTSNHQYVGRLEPSEEKLGEIISLARRNNFEAVVIVTAESQQNFGEQVLGLEEGWLEDVTDFLAGHDLVTVLNHDGVAGAFLFEVEASDG